MTGTTFEFNALRASSTGNGLIIKIDGVQVANIGRAQAAWAYERAIVTVAVGSHLIEISLNTGTTYGAFCGVLARTTTGPIVVNDAASGNTINNYAGYEDYRLKAIPAWAPDLTIIELTANDYLGQVALATYTTRLTLVANYAKQAGGSVLLLTCPGSSTINAIPQTSYEGVCAAWAAANGAAYFNIHGLWGTWAAAQAAGFMGGDFIHPNSAGHLDYYNKLIGYLTA